MHCKYTIPILIHVMYYSDFISCYVLPVSNKRNKGFYCICKSIKNAVNSLNLIFYEYKLQHKKGAQLYPLTIPEICMTMKPCHGTFDTFISFLPLYRRCSVLKDHISNICLFLLLQKPLM